MADAGRTVYGALLVSMVVLCLAGLRSSSFAVQVVETVAPSKEEYRHAGTKTTLPDDWEVWENCTVSKIDVSPSSQKTKPFWFPTYPQSLDFAKPMIEGLGGPARNFYTKKCMPYDNTATCGQVHPMVGVTPPPEAPDRVANFYDSIIMGIRNPTTAIPAFQQEKAILYHHQVGQIEEDSWRKTRDEWYNASFANWKKMLDTWKAMPYNVALYLPYEHFHDVKRGPEILKQLARVLRDAGFPTKVSEESLPCLWYKSMGKQRLLDYHEHGYEYSGFLPGYTEEQKGFFLDEMEKLINQYEDDDALTTILKEYHADIDKHLRIDTAWTEPI